MAFSSDNTMLATAATDGFLRVWNTFNGRLVYEHSFYPDNKVPISYIIGTYNLLATTSATTLSVIDPTGNSLQDIDAGATIIHAQQFAQGRKVAILTSENRIKLYELENGNYLGYLPAFNVTPITSFDFNKEATTLLVGHEDGSIYKIDVESNLVLPNSMPILRLIKDNEVIVEGDEFTEDIPEPVYYIPVEDAGFYFKPGHGIELLAGFSLLPNPNLSDVDVTVGYLNSFWLHPFHVGARLITSIGFPRADFPYNYRLYGKPLEPPLMMSMTVKFPVGVAITPFENKDIMFYAETSLGLAVHQLWNRKFGKETIAGYLYPSFVGSIAVGAGWKGLSLKLHGDYDARLGFLFSVNIGWLFELPYKKKAVASGELEEIQELETAVDESTEGTEEGAEIVDGEEIPETDAETDGETPVTDEVGEEELSLEGEELATGEKLLTSEEVDETEVIEEETITEEIVEETITEETDEIIEEG